MFQYLFPHVSFLQQIQQLKLTQDNEDLIPDDPIPLGMNAVKEWKCYALNEHPGLLIIRSSFTPIGQRYWSARCLQDYPQSPNHNNLNERLFSKAIIDNWWKELQNCDDKEEKRRMKISMRWSTLGYHHNWDSKVYSENQKTEFPQDLAKMTNFFAKVLGFQDYEAQAAIVNYYPFGTTLAGHTDHSEQNLQAPLFSFSFGQSAIFLIGGTSKDIKPSAILLKSGDVLVMSHESRICYHAVPRIVKAKEEPWNNIMITMQKETISATTPAIKKLKMDLSNENESIQFGLNPILYQQIQNEDFWQPFQSYLNESRININVRQVLNKGATCLE